MSVMLSLLSMFLCLCNSGGTFIEMIFLSGTRMIFGIYQSIQASTEDTFNKGGFGIFRFFFLFFFFFFLLVITSFSLFFSLFLFLLFYTN